MSADSSTPTAERSEPSVSAGGGGVGEQPATHLDLPSEHLDVAMIGDQVSPITLRPNYEANPLPGFVLGIDYLARKYIGGMRKVRPDGNCFYRAFLYSYLDTLRRLQGTQGAVEEKARFISLISDSKAMLEAFGYPEYTFEDFMNELLQLVEDLFTMDCEQLLAVFQADGKSDYYTWFMRLLTAMSLRSDQDSYLPYIMESGSYDMETFCRNEVEPMGKECDHMQIMALAKLLGLTVHIEYLDGRVNAEDNSLRVVVVGAEGEVGEIVPELSNLSSSTIGRLAYVHLNEVYIVGAGQDPVILPIQNRVVLHQVAFGSILGFEVLVIATSGGVQFWSKSGSSMLFFFPKTSLPELDETMDSFFRGIGFSDSHIFCGTSSGQLIAFTSAGMSSGAKSSFDGSDLKFDLAIQNAGSNSPVLSIAASSNVVACGCDNGHIIFLDPTKGFNLKFKHSSAIAPCNALIARGDIVVAGYSTGHIRLFRTNINEMAVEITAHIRPITGLTWHPRNSCFASCSEDQLINIWEFPDFISRSTSSLNIIQSEKLKDSLLTGIAFISHDRIAAAAFDEDIITVLSTN